LLQKVAKGAAWYYETPVLRGYREALEAKAAAMPESSIRAAPGWGAPISLYAKRRDTSVRPLRLFSAGSAVTSAVEFLTHYREDIKALPTLPSALPTLPAPPGPLENAARRFKDDEKAALILTTLLPTAAAIKRRQTELDGPETVKATREYCLEKLEQVLGR
jgi:hypothetical protein